MTFEGSALPTDIHLHRWRYMPRPVAGSHWEARGPNIRIRRSDPWPPYACLEGVVCGFRVQLSACPSVT